MNNNLVEVYDREVFKIFVKLHPVEAYDSSPDEFCRFMRSEGYNISDIEVKNLVDDFR